MLLGLAYQLTRFLTDLVLVRTGSDAQLRAKVLALRHQLRVLKHKVGKPGRQPGDRVLLAALSQLLPRSAWSALLPKPETLLRLAPRLRRAHRLSRAAWKFELAVLHLVHAVR